MAEIVNNPKGFKVIKIKATELMDIIFGSLGICDYCSNASFEGYYIAVLHSYYCPDCYEDWMKRCEYYEEDAPYENQNFNAVVESLKKKGYLE